MITYTLVLYESGTGVNICQQQRLSNPKQKQDITGYDAVYRTFQL